MHSGETYAYLTSATTLRGGLKAPLDLAVLSFIKAMLSKTRDVQWSLILNIRKGLFYD
jgi:hypothetical protein